jgi:hypothetical protein
MSFEIFQDHRDTTVRVTHKLLTNSFRHVLDMRRWNNMECLITNMRMALHAETSNMDRIHFDKALNALPEAESRLERIRGQLMKSPADSPAQ